jgi:hypothetical protein
MSSTWYRAGTTEPPDDRRGKGQGVGQLEVEVTQYRSGLAGLLLVNRSAQVDDVDPPTESIVKIAEEAKAKGISGIPYFLFPRHELQPRPLFERIPELGDINQRQLPDCWFLASLAAIITMGTGHAIRLMMADVGEYAYVRLWDGAQLPHFVRVHKSLIEIEGTATFHSIGGLWAAVLEKAMTAIDKEGRYDPRNAAYGRNAGALAHIAMQALLGVRCEVEYLAESELHFNQTGEDFETLRKVLKGDNNNSPSMLIKTALFGGLVEPAKLNLFYDTVWEPWAESVGLYLKWMSVFGGASKGGVYRLEDFERFMREFAAEPMNQMAWTTCSSSFTFTAYHSDLSAFQANPYTVQMPDFRRQAPTALQAVQCISQWARQKLVFTGRRSTGVYTTAQVQLYNDIEQHLLAFRPLCLGTREVIGTPGPNRGSSGESTSKGLAVSHAYAVTGCYTDLHTGARYVQVFNPWGVIGRGYTFAPNEIHLKPSPGALQRWVKGQSAYETQSPLFWLELADVTKRCRRMYVCKTTPEVILAGRKVSRF